MKIKSINNKTGEVVLEDENGATVKTVIPEAHRVDRAARQAFLQKEVDSQQKSIVKRMKRAKLKDKILYGIITVETVALIVMAIIMLG